MYINDDFLLKGKTARELYHVYAEQMPIIDYHCHVNAGEIAENLQYDNITQAWIALDHYKWTAMRSCGIEEKYITAEGSDRDKFFAWAEVLPKCIGSPLYHRSHMELKHVFGFDKTLSPETAREAWEVCNRALVDMPVRELIKRAHVKLICSTDDILDPLKAHDAIQSDPSFDVKTAPAFRTDSAVNISLPGFSEYIGKLSDAAGCPITDFAGLAKAIRIRMDDFAKRGCRSIDQALMSVPCAPFTQEEIDRILKKAMAGGIPTKQEEGVYLSGLLSEIAAACREREWVMQLHVGAMRDNNSNLLRTVGVDVGGDCIGSFGNLSMLPQFLDALNEADHLPKMIIYSINPADNPVLDSMIGCFQEAGIVGKIQHGAAWWFNDSLNGIRNHVTSLASMSVLGNFIGTLTDSRAYVNYSRHEYFRRILCDTVGEWIDRGEYPRDVPLVGSMIQDICCRNVNRYFGFGL